MRFPFIVMFAVVPQLAVAAPRIVCHTEYGGSTQKVSFKAVSTFYTVAPRPIDDDFKTLLANTIEDAADDSGWAFLGIVGGVLTKKMPDFDPRNYGYKKLSLLVKSLSKIVEIEERPSENKELKLVYVRNRIR